MVAASDSHGGSLACWGIQSPVFELLAPASPVSAARAAARAAYYGGVSGAGSAPANLSSPDIGRSPKGALNSRRRLSSSVTLLPQLQSPKAAAARRSTSVPRPSSASGSTARAPASIMAAMGVAAEFAVTERPTSGREFASAPAEAPAVRSYSEPVGAATAAAPMVRRRSSALLAAMEQRDYWKLKAAIAAGRAADAGNADIYDAERLLRSLEVPKLPKNLCLSFVRAQKLMRWNLVTGSPGADDVESRRASCRHAFDPSFGERFSLESGMVQSVLTGIAPRHIPADKWLFKGLVKLAGSTQERCMVNNAGNFVLTRDASLSALAALLTRAEAADTPLGNAIWALKQHAESFYRLRVAAAQVNFHPDGTAFHKQHQDKHRGGTVAYSLGSSRKACVRPCGEGEWGTGRPLRGGEEAQLLELQSGDAMFFNTAWNESNSHGIPRLEEPCGPRLSLVFFGHCGLGLSSVQETCL